MFLRTIRRVLGAALVLALPVSAQAALTLCNDTGAEQAVAIGYKDTAGWTSQGWWRIAAGECTSVVSGPLAQRFYYLRVETEGWQFQDDKLSFCVRDERFSIKGDENCARRGFRQEEFARIDVGPAARDHRHSLSTNLNRRLRDGGPTPQAGKQPLFHAVAVFQDCRIEAQPYQSFCTFIGEGQRFLVYRDDRLSPALWQQLQGLPQGRRVALAGQREHLFDTASRLLLQSLDVLALNRADRLLARLQGEWRSLEDPDDRFRVHGAERINTYAGAETSVEYVAIRDRCADDSGQGPYLFTWDNNAGTGLCYRIAAVSDQELSLEYMPQGKDLTYRRAPAPVR